MKAPDFSSALRLTLLMTVGGWLGFQFVGRAILWLVFGADRGTGEVDRYDIYGMILGMLAAIAVHLRRKMKTEDHSERQFLRAELLVILVGSLIFAGYCTGYICTGFLVGRGIMSQAVQAQLDRTIYYPITYARRYDIMPIWDLERVRRRATQIGYQSQMRNR